LEAYNNGCHYGIWIDATQEVKQIYKEIFDMLKSSPFAGTEEWEIHDWEYMGTSLPDYASVEDAHERAMFMLEHGANEALCTAILEYACDLKQAMYFMTECYQGEYDSEEDFAHQLFADCYEIPEYLENYIDYEAIARDLFICDYISFRIDGVTHVFRQE
jgi:antirestriction protein